ncbi:MAG: hypothetical protein ACI841_000273 [Planctomycetota bacterium]
MSEGVTLPFPAGPRLTIVAIDSTTGGRLEPAHLWVKVEGRAWLPQVHLNAQGISAGSLLEPGRYLLTLGVYGESSYMSARTQKERARLLTVEEGPDIQYEFVHKYGCSEYRASHPTRSSLNTLLLIR